MQPDDDVTRNAGRESRRAGCRVDCDRKNDRRFQTPDYDARNVIGYRVRMRMTIGLGRNTSSRIVVLVTGKTYARLEHNMLVSTPAMRHSYVKQCQIWLVHLLNKIINERKQLIDSSRRMD